MDMQLSADLSINNTEDISPFSHYISHCSHNKPFLSKDHQDT